MNKVKEVAKLLGIEMGKPIIVKCRHYNPYYLEERGLVDCEGDIDNYTLSGLLVGKFEIEKTILTDKEKRYLEGVLNPFKDRIVYIKKRRFPVGDCLTIILKKYFNENFIEELDLPFFEHETMYIRMEVVKEYTLEELGLFVED